MSEEEEEAVVVNLDEQSGECQIREGGAYLLSGELKGMVSIDAEEQVVHLILDNVSIASGRW